ncbi:MAG: putative metal-binding protein (TIGR02443 family) [Candidatus Pseudothioglobus sp.]
MSNKKRFIAGAVCPECGVEDRIYVLTDSSGQSRHCNDCEFSQRLDSLSENAPDVEDNAAELGTWQPIKLLDR